MLTQRALHSIEGEEESLEQEPVTPAEKPAAEPENNSATGRPNPKQLNIFEDGVLQFDEVGR